MPGPVSDSFDAEWGTTSAKVDISDALEGCYDRLTPAPAPKITDSDRTCTLLAYCVCCHKIQTHTQEVTETAEWTFRTAPTCSVCGTDNRSGDLCYPIRK